MGGFVDPQFVDLLLSRLNELQERHEEKLITGSVESLEDYKLFRGQLEGIQFAIREIKEIAERTFTDDIQRHQGAGYHILIGLPEIEDTFDGVIVKTKSAIDIEETSSVVGFVIAMGPDCYTDKKRFPNGPWCKEGDFVLMRAYSGTRIKIHGQEFRIINDDTPEAVVDDPRGISRV